MPKKIRIKYLQFLYELVRNPTKKKSIVVTNVGFMSEENYDKCMAIVNQCKQSK